MYILSICVFKMNQEDQIRVRANYKWLVKEINCSEIQDHLYQEGVFDEEDLENVDISRVTPHNANRYLLRVILRKENNAFVVLCAGLRETGQGHIADRLENTDPSKHSYQNLLTAHSSEEKIRAMENTLQSQLQYISITKDEIDGLRGVLELKDKQSQELVDKIQELEKQVCSTQGLTEEHVVAYIRDYLNKQDDMDNVDSPDSSKSLLDQYMPLVVQHWIKQEDKTVVLRKIEKIARILGRDIVQYLTCSGEPPPPPNTYASTMRTIVEEILKMNESKFEKFIGLLDISEMNGLQALENIADEMFYDSEEKPLPNWGHIVTLYAFGGYVARHCSQHNITQMAEFIGDFLGFYVSRKLGKKIEQTGGWDSFIEYFSKNKSSLWSNLGHGIVSFGIWFTRKMYIPPDTDIQQ